MKDWEIEALAAEVKAQGVRVAVLEERCDLLRRACMLYGIALQQLMGPDRDEGGNGAIIQ